MATHNGAPRAVQLAGVVLGIEAAALFVIAGLLAVATARGQTESLGRAAFGVLAGLAAGAMLLRVGLGVARVEGWARAPAVVAQLLLLPVGYTLAVTAEQPGYGVPVLLASAAELFLLVTPEARAAFLER